MKSYFKKTLALTSIVFFLFILTPTSHSQNETIPFSKKWSDEEILKLGYMPDEVIVKFKTDKINLKDKNGKRKLDDFITSQKKELGAKVLTRMESSHSKKERLNKLSARRVSALKNSFLKEKRRIEFMNSAILKLNIDDSIEETVQELKKHPDIEYVSPNYVFKLDSVPTELDYSNGNLWAFNNDSEAVEQSIAINAPDYGTNNPDPYNNDPDIQAAEAWGITTGGTNKIVAVLDMGINYNHSDLWPNMWDAPDEECIMGYNGETPIIEDCPNHGWDFAYDDNDPQDDNGHGTHVAGIIGGVWNNGGIAGINQNVEIMAVKVGSNIARLDAVLSGIEFAKNNGADIINASWGYNHNPANLKNSIEEFMNADEDGRLFIASSGNEGQNNESSHHYPSDYSDFAGGVPDNLISVTATDQADAMASFANYGSTSVDLGAPGTNILSSYIEAHQEFEEDFSDGIGEGKEFDKDDNDDPNNWYVSNGLLFTDTANYQSGVQDASVLSDAHDLSDALDDTAVLTFDVWCDTEPQSDDYLDVYVTDGNNPDQLNKIDDQPDPINEENNLLYQEWEVNGYDGKFGQIEYLIPNDYLTNNISFDFAWNTDASNTGGSYRGCLIDNVILSWVETGYRHYYDSGTSMAAPFVTGVAALVWNEYPDLTAHQVKEIIMESGDELDSDWDPDNPNADHPIASGKRLNAYRALVMAEQVANGQETILYPTIHAKPAGGYWSSTSTWEEGRIPNSSDTVEINGAVTLPYNTTVSGLLINSGATLKNYSVSSYTLTVTGDIVNNGTIQNYSVSRTLTLMVDGNMENNGTVSNYLSHYKGNIVNNDMFTAGIILSGTSEQTISGTQPFGDITVNNTVTVSGDITVNKLTVNNGKILTIGSGNTVTVAGNLICSGAINGGNILLGGAGQYFYGAGTMDVDNFTIGGTGTKSLTSNFGITGDVTVASGVSLKNYYSSNYTLTINGDVINNGTITNYGPSKFLYLVVNGDMENNGTVSNSTSHYKGDISNNDTFTAGIILDGTSEQTISGTQPFGDIMISNTVTVSGDISINKLTVNTGKTLTISSEGTVTVAGHLICSGTISDGNIVMDGGTQYFYASGTIEVDSLTFGGTGTKYIQGDYEITGDVTVTSGSTLMDYNNYRTLTINGTVVNNGTMASSLYGRLTLDITGSFTNNGSFSCIVYVNGERVYP